MTWGSTDVDSDIVFRTLDGLVLVFLLQNRVGQGSLLVSLVGKSDWLVHLHESVNVHRNCPVTFLYLFSLVALVEFDQNFCRDQTVKESWV